MSISSGDSNTCLFEPAPYYKQNKGFFLGSLFKPLGGPRGLNKKVFQQHQQHSFRLATLTVLLTEEGIKPKRRGRRRSRLLAPDSVLVSAFKLSQIFR